MPVMRNDTEWLNSNAGFAPTFRSLGMSGEPESSPVSPTRVNRGC
jgi:hypothetical protein